MKKATFCDYPLNNAETHGIVKIHEFESRLRVFLHDVVPHLIEIRLTEVCDGARPS